MSNTQAPLRTPEEWIRELDLAPVMDPDGWRGPNGRPWTDAIARDEFNRRYAQCTLGPKTYRAFL